MNKRRKRFDEILEGKQNDYAFADVKNFLEFYGFDYEKTGSSHFIFRRKPYPHITIVVHGQRVKRWYVKRAVQILKDYEIIEK